MTVATPWLRNDVGYGGMRWITVGSPTSLARRFPGFPFVFKLDRYTGSM